jgi:hypothetical protein
MRNLFWWRGFDKFFEEYILPKFKIEELLVVVVDDSVGCWDFMCFEVLRYIAFVHEDTNNVF